MSDYIYTSDGELCNADELAHYGVPGMKWGHRKALPKSDTRKRYDSTKKDYKEARKAYNKSYNRAYSYSQRHPISQWVGKKAKAESDRRWDKAIDDAVKQKKARDKYKSAKRARKNRINSTYQRLQRDASFKDRMLYNDATRKKAAKYMVDNNMKLKDARQKANKEAIRNTAVIVSALAGYSAYQLYKSR